MDKKKAKKIIGVSCVALGTAFIGLNMVAKKKKADSIYENEPEEKNKLEGKRVIFVEDESYKENADGVRGYLKEIGESNYKASFYDKYVKRSIDVILSFGGLVVLSPVMVTIALAIKIEDPGPVLFTQKRMGQNKQYFKLHKFRSMKMETPHDVPTHQLENPDQYITKVGKFIRAHSLDELPQIWDIFIGNMSVIGPRPGLWNQDLLTAERDKYNANDIKPGLTGWAQINGRDELEIPVKAKLDGEYVKNESLLFDAKCFLGTVSKVGHDDSVVEGGTGEMKKNQIKDTIYMNDWKNYKLINMPRVTVIIPTYKRSVEFLSRAVKSVIDQTYKNIEIIVIDDSPSNYIERDNIKKYMDSIVNQDIKYYQNEKNMGGSLARNRGIELATGEYISFLDDDDEYMPEKIEKQIKFMLYGGNDLSFSNMIMYNSSGNVVDFREYTDIPAFDNESLLHYHLMHHMTGTPTFMFKTNKLREIGGFEDAKMGQEFYLMLKSIEKGLSIGYIPECDVKVYKHEEGGITQGKNKIDGENRLYEFKKKYFSQLNKQETRFINFRHWAVMVVAFKRNSMYVQMIEAGIKAFFSSPSDFTTQVFGFLNRVKKYRS